MAAVGAWIPALDRDEAGPVCTAGDAAAAATAAKCLVCVAAVQSVVVEESFIFSSSAPSPSIYIMQDKFPFSVSRVVVAGGKKCWSSCALFGSFKKAGKAEAVERLEPAK